MKISTILSMIVLAVGVFTTSVSYADRGDKTLIIHTVSYHSDDCYRDCTMKYNQENFGLGVSYGLTDVTDVRFGSYINSFDIQSTYLAFNFGKRYGNFKPGILLGATTGYHTITKRTSFGEVTPGILPNVGYDRGRFHANLGYIPANFAGKSDVVVLILGVRF